MKTNINQYARKGPNTPGHSETTKHHLHMKNKSLFLTATAIISFAIILSSACGPETKESKNPAATSKPAPAPKKEESAESSKGVGEIKHVELTSPLDAEMIKKGNEIYDMKCSSCHKLTDERVVGPGWAGVTSRRQPEWIMNMVMNTDAMLDKDPAAQKLLETCLIRMPNQGLDMKDCRSILEFMRKNDNQK